MACKRNVLCTQNLCYYRQLLKQIMNRPYSLNPVCPLVSILKNWRSKFRGFTVYVNNETIKLGWAIHWYICLEYYHRLSQSLPLCMFPRVRSGLKSTWIYRTVLKSPWKLNLPWKVLENHSNALKISWILLFSVGINTVYRDLNQYKIIVPLFGAAFAAPNKGTTILY